MLAFSPDTGALLRAAEQAVVAGSFTGGGGWVLKGIALVRQGRLGDILAWSAETRDAADRTGDSLLGAYSFLYPAMVALARGQVEEAARVGAAAPAERPDDVSSQLAAAAFAVALELAAGRPAEARSLAEALPGSRHLPHDHLVAVIALRHGDAAPARRALDDWQAGGGRLPQDITGAGRRWALAECAHATGDRDAARRLRDATAPYAGQLLLYQLSFVATSADHVLGLLAETLGERDRAAEHYAAALALEERSGAAALAARTRAALARL